MLQKTKAEMYPLIAAWQKSNMQQKEFCEQHQLRLHTFSYWLQKYKKEQKGEENGEHQSAFIPLQVSKPVGQVLGELEVQYPNGIKLDDIALNGIRTQPRGGYVTGKLFATSLEDATLFGKNNFKFDKLPNTVIKVNVPNSVMNNAYKFTADGMNAVSIPANQLKFINQIKAFNYSPITF